MIPVTQTKVVVKNSAGDWVVHGNCYAAVIASMLELPITEVPNVEVLFHVDDYLWNTVMDSFLMHKGYELSCDDRYKVFHPELQIHGDAGDVNLLRDELKDDYYLVSGLSKRGVQHITIYQNGKMVHDPHPTKEGIDTLERFESLRKIQNNTHE